MSGGMKWSCAQTNGHWKQTAVWNWFHGKLSMLKVLDSVFSLVEKLI